MSNRRVFFVFVFVLFLNPSCLLSQRISYQNRDGSKDAILNLVTESGGNVMFNINSLKRYNEGMELIDWTRIAISVSGIEDHETWRVELFANEFYGDIYGRELDIDYLSITVSEINPDPDPLNQLQIFNIEPLISGTHPIVTHQGNGTFQIYLSYSIGQDPAKTLLGEHPDYFLLDLAFDLSLD